MPYRDALSVGVVSAAMGRLDSLDLTQRIGRKEYEDRLAVLQRRWLHLRLHLGGQMGTGELGPGLLFVFEGSDAAGKGGAIKRLVEPLDPRHYRVSSFAKPTFDEKRHPFLWRFSPYVPGLGGMSVFDRSWYGRVLVERIESFATHDQWSRAYEEIVQFERANALEGVIIVKFWLQISPEEQLSRFEDRQNDPLRRWKITDEDWRNRTKAERVPGRRRGDVRTHGSRPGPVGRHLRRAETPRSGAGAGDGDRPRRAGHDPLGHARAGDR